MAFSKKTLRQRGSKSCSRGFSRRYRGGSSGGTGNAGLDHHKKCQRVVLEKKAIRDRKAINLKDIERSFTKLLKKGYLAYSTSRDSYYTTEKFNAKYKKVLAEGELSFKLKLRINCSSSAKLKTQ